MSSRTTPFVAVGAAVLWATASATAQTPSTGEPRNLSIPAEPLANALNDLAEQSGLQVMFASELVARLKSPEVRGSLTAAEALQRLLGNTGLRFEFVNPHTIAIMGPERKHSTSGSTPAPAPSPDHDRSTTPSAEAPANPGDKMPRRNFFAQLLGLSAACGAALHGGTACAQDAAATAAADSTTLDTVVVTARKRDESLAKVPVSITVFTAQALEDYNIQSFDDYATKTPEHLVRLRRRPDRLCRRQNRGDPRHHRPEFVRHCRCHRILYRRYAGTGFGGSANLGHRQHRSAQGASRNPLRGELARRQRTHRDQEART